MLESACYDWARKVLDQILWGKPGTLLRSIGMDSDIAPIQRRQAKFVRQSWLLLGISTLLLIALTVFESAFVGVSLGTQRFISFLALVAPAAAGAVLGIISLTRREGWAWLAIAAIVLNALFALFHLFVILFAG
jgi:hypothetical protein